MFNDAAVIFWGIIMKLAEALIERADLQRKLHQLKERLQQNAQHQEGESPSEDPNALLQEYQGTLWRFTRLVAQINTNNNRIHLKDGMSMVSALAQRDSLKMHHATLVALADAATTHSTRYSPSEIKMLSAVDVREIRKQADQVAKACRTLDIQIQEANWTHELN